MIASVSGTFCVPLKGCSAAVIQPLATAPVQASVAFL